jgi:hypothetical protein
MISISAHDILYEVKIPTQYFSINFARIQYMLKDLKLFHLILDELSQFLFLIYKISFLKYNFNHKDHSLLCFKICQSFFD